MHSDAEIQMKYTEGLSIYYVCKNTGWVGLEKGQFGWCSILYLCWHRAPMIGGWWKKNPRLCWRKICMVPRGCCNTILASIDFKSVGSLWRMGNSYHIILITEFNNQFRNYKYKVWVTTKPSPCDLPKPSNLYPQVNSEYFNRIYQTCKDLYNVHDVKSGYLKKKDIL